LIAPAAVYFVLEKMIFGEPLIISRVIDCGVAYSREGCSE
jgi:hypothetical protein